MDILIDKLQARVMTIYLNNYDYPKDPFYEVHSDEFEDVFGFAAECGEWRDRWLYLSNGLELVFSVDRYHDLAIESNNSSGNLLLQFCLSGGIRVVTPSVTGANDEYEVSANQSLLFHGPEPYDRCYPAINQSSQWIRLYCPADFWMRLQRSIAPLPQALQRLVAGDGTQHVYQPGMITPAMHLVLQQMMNCSLPGALRRLYLEGKVMELLALQFGQWSEHTGERLPLASAILSPAEIDRLHEAKAILTTTFQNPPSLLELAQRVGLSGHKLKRGFRELFDTTVLGYVLSLRLAHAQQLLRGTDLPIALVADLVGYENPSYFSHWFRREVGVTPTVYRSAPSTYNL